MPAAGQRHAASSFRPTVSGSGSSTAPRPQESRDHWRAASDDCADRRGIARRHLGAGRHDHLRDSLTGNRPAARVGCRRRDRPCSRSPIASAGKAITSGPSSCLEARRSSSRLLRSPVESTTRRSRCWICGPARRRCSSAAAATRTTCRRGIWSTASRGRCAPWHSTSRRLEVVGTPAPVLEGVVTTAAGRR